MKQKRRAISREEMASPDYEPRTRGKAIGFTVIADRFLGEVVGSSCEAIGALMKLLTLDWLQDGIDFNPKKLANFLDISAVKFRTLWDDSLAQHFVQLPNGRYTNPALEDQRDEKQYWREVTRRAGLASARKRETEANERSTPVANDRSTPVDPSNSTDVQPSSLQSPVSSPQSPASSPQSRASSHTQQQRASGPTDERTVGAPVFLPPDFDRVAARLGFDPYREAFVELLAEVTPKRRAAFVNALAHALDGTSGEPPISAEQAAIGIIDYSESGIRPLSVGAFRSFLINARPAE